MHLKIQPAICVAVAIVVSGCGTYVPNVYSFSSTAKNDRMLVNAITESVQCEISDALNDIIEDDIIAQQQNPAQGRQAEWLEEWGVQSGLTITIKEQSSINPSIAWMPTSIFTIGGGVSRSATATRVDTQNSFATVKQILKKGRCESDTVVAKFSSGSLLIYSDLKIKEWLGTFIVSAATGSVDIPKTPDTPLKRNAISHQVKFQIVTSGNVSPKWTLTEANINPSGSFLSVSRDSTHELLVTLGPAKKGDTGLTGPAANTFFAAELASAINRDRID